jgi:hypothetical protein
VALEVTGSSPVRDPTEIHLSPGSRQGLGVMAEPGGWACLGFWWGLAKLSHNHLVNNELWLGIFGLAPWPLTLALQIVARLLPDKK